MVESTPVVVVGGGPAGLMAAEVISAAGHTVSVVERMPSLGRKLLMAGRGGLNLTHSEPLERLIGRFGAAPEHLAPHIRAFPPADVIAWCEGLGQETFIGSSRRVFPKAMKASPLLRAWLQRLERQGVRFLPRHRWLGFSGSRGIVVAREGEEAPRVIESRATVLALGGASWPRLGSDGAWVDTLAGCGIAVAPLTSANCGLLVAWTPRLLERFEGAAVKGIALALADDSAVSWIKGEVVVTRTGLEGSPAYMLAPAIRKALAERESARLLLDLRADIDEAALGGRLRGPRPKQSFSTYLAKSASLSPAATALLREGHGLEKLPQGGVALARLIKAVPLEVRGLASLERAISTAGGVAWSELDGHLMLMRRPGVFVAGEMLDWEAPTGGYLLQACLSTGRAAGLGVVQYLERTLNPEPDAVAP